MDEMQKERLKQSITTILLTAINGSDNQYRTRNGHVNWEIVEKHIHQLIDDIECESSDVEYTDEVKEFVVKIDD